MYAIGHPESLQQSGGEVNIQTFLDSLACQVLPARHIMPTSWLQHGPQNTTARCNLTPRWNTVHTFKKPLTACLGSGSIVR
jgi:hypothetical protein